MKPQESKYEVKWYLNADVTPAEFMRDMRRLEQLRKQYDRTGMNTVESNEQQKLIEKYDMENSYWYQGKYIE